MHKPWLMIGWLMLTMPAAGQTLAENGNGRMRVAGNEFIAESKTDDPSAVRLRAPATQGSSGKISFDAGTTEHTLLVGAQSPGRGGEFSLYLLRPGEGSTDEAMAKVLEVNHEGGFRFRLPIFAPNLDGDRGGATDHLVSPSGRWWLYIQDDGSIVRYELVDGVLCARWSEWTGPIPKHTGTEPCSR